MPSYDLVLRNGMIVDGSGGPRFRGTVGVRGERIVAVMRGSPNLDGARTVDCSGLVIAPGFVDPHSHSDGSVAACPDNENSLRNGITTEVTGNCGHSAAPGGERSVEQWFDGLERTGLAANLALFVGQGTVRGLVMGSAERRFPTEEELARQKDLIAAAMRQGCLGMSSGRAYVPGCFASTWECTELARVVAGYGGVYSFHIQDQSEFVVPATEEVLEIARRSGVKVLIGHQKVVGKSSWGRAEEILRLLDRARERGVEVMSDLYPYAYSAIIYPGALLPKELLADGPSAAAKRLAEPGVQAKLKAYLDDAPLEAAYVLRSLHRCGVVWCRRTKEFEWMDLQEVADHMGADLHTALLNLLIENDLGVKLAGIMAEQDVQAFLKHPCSMVSTDSEARNQRQDVAGEASLSVHPRCYGTHTRVLGRYVRELGLLTLEEAVRKMTSLPAEYLGLFDRGRVRRDLKADLVVFDPLTVGDRATLEDPVAFPVGVSHVVVNGEVALDGGQYLATRAGKVLRDPQGRCLYQ